MGANGQAAGGGGRSFRREERMQRVHDRGGWPDAGRVDRTEPDYSMWEKRTDALMRALTASGRMRVDELRRAIESLESGQYERMAYYERWITAIELLMVEKGILTREEVDRKVGELDAREA